MAKSRLNYQNSDQKGRDFIKDTRENNLDLREADFSHADLQNADFSGLKLYKANFSHAKINGTIFRGADLREANFSYASVDDDRSQRELDFSNSQIQGANFYRSVLIHAKFTNAKTGLAGKVHVLIFMLIGLFSSAFTAAIVSTFLFHFFLASPQKSSLPGKKPSLLNSISIFLISACLLIGTRIFINNIYGSDLVFLHILFGISVIFLVLALALIKGDAETNFSSLFIIAIVSLIPLLVPLLLPQVRQFEVSLKDTILANFIRGLGISTNGRIISAFIGGVTGASLGCWFSRLAITRDEKLGWLNFDWLWKWYIRFVVITGTNFNKANLTDVDFTSANLKGASFEGAIIEKVHWHKAKYLDCANVGKNNYLKYLDIRYLLVVRKWKNGSNFDGLDLEGIDLKNADLNNASFIGTNLSQANLHKANLKNAILKKASLDGADLSEAILTGACIESWSIDEKSQLSGVECDYLFLKNMPDPITGIQERLPNAAAGVDFEKGDFETLFKKDSSIVQLFIRYTDDRQALTTAFQLLNDDSSLVFQGFEFVGDNALVKYRVSQPMSKDAVSNRFYRKLKETQFTQRDSDQREDSNESLLNFMLKLVKEIMSNTPKYDMRHANIGNIADDVAGDLNSTQNIYLNNRRTLSEAATEIQQLLKQLEQTSSNATESERIAYVIENASPTLKNRAISALQAGGETAIDEFFLENKYLKVGKAVIRAWLESSH
jgi:uncharacterized protein YjbI with pentapeptide repeats